MKRNSILFAIIGCASFCLAAEPSRISPAAPEDFSRSETMTLEQGVLVMNSGNHVTKQTIAVDRTRPGRLTFEYKLAPGAKPQTFVIAVHSVTAEGKYLVGGRIFAVAGTETELVAPVRKGDRILKLKDASRWQKLPLKLA